MTVVDRYKHGSFCWAELGSPEPAVTTRFYSALFDLGIHHGKGYTILRKRGRDVAAIHRMPADREARGETPYWLLHVNVDSIDRAVARVEPRGGRVIVPPREVYDAGRVAVLEDPSGAHLALWQAVGHAGAGLIDEPATMCWWELNTRDADEAGVFYSDVIGWRRAERSVDAATRYTDFFVGERKVGGMLQMNEAWGGMPSHWMTYFRVEDCDEGAALAEKLGGAILVAPCDIPPVGRFAVVSDPHGGIFSIVAYGQAGRGSPPERGLTAIGRSE
ncbi:VOC family protein [Nannocystis pusilla]|uniref:VOC family protein n=1 Tax=Nannocystis pusilla TaxID=889268 RepID=A0ABS7TZL1_9BACT|nr:VOC family protein [Nannocystis pusilla]